MSNLRMDRRQRGNAQSLEVMLKRAQIQFTQRIQKSLERLVMQLMARQIAPGNSEIALGEQGLSKSSVRKV